jgi:hypothetical protein
MVNLLTLSRLLLLIGVVVIACQPPSAFQFISVPLMILVFVTDGLEDAMYEPCLDRIKRHQADGDRIVLLSGTPDTAWDIQRLSFIVFRSSDPGRA